MTHPVKTMTAEALVSADWNNYVRDNLNGFGTWTSYTPTWTSSGTAPAINNGTLLGSYAQLGKTICVSIYVQMGSTTTFGTGVYSFALPVAAVSTRSQALSAWLFDFNLLQFKAGSGFILSTTGSVCSVISGSDSVAYAQIGQTAPFTWAVSDTISITGTYEAA